MASKVRFSVEEDERLIEMVARHPILWNMSDPEFKNVMKKELLWIEIGKMVNIAEGHCKIRWRSIRDHYKRQKKQEKNAETGSAATKKRASYWGNLRFLDAVDEDERQCFPNVRTESNEEVEETHEQSTSSHQSEAEDERVVSDLCTTILGHSNENSIKRKYNISTGASTSPISSNLRIRKIRKDSIVTDILKERRLERLQYRKYLEKISAPEVEDEIFLFFKAMASTVQKFDPEVKTEAKMKVFNLVTELEMRHHRSRACANSFPTHNFGSNGFNSTASSYGSGMSSALHPSSNFENNVVYTNSNEEEISPSVKKEIMF